MSIEAMKQVKQELEHIQQYGYATDIDHAIKILGHAIVDAQKPVTWAETNDMVCALLRQAHDILSMSSLPPSKPWVSLTDDEKLSSIWTDGSFHHGVEWAEAKLKEKNT